MPDLRISHVGYDRKHTARRGPRTRGSRSARLQQAVKAGRHRRADAALSRRADEPEPAGHDRDRRARAPGALPRGRRGRRASSSPADRSATRPWVWSPGTSRRTGIPTVIMGGAKDIVEHCGVPRFLFSDFPLGNSAGRPFDAESQARHARAGAAPAGDGAGAAHDRAVAAALERRTRPGSSTTATSTS